MFYRFFGFLLRIYLNIVHQFFSLPLHIYTWLNVMKHLINGLPVNVVKSNAILNIYDMKLQAKSLEFTLCGHWVMEADAICHL